MARHASTIVKCTRTCATAQARTTSFPVFRLRIGVPGRRGVSAQAERTDGVSNGTDVEALTGLDPEVAALESAVAQPSLATLASMESLDACDGAPPIPEEVPSTAQPAPSFFGTSTGARPEDTPDHMKPGSLDSKHFEQHETVAFWNDYRFPPAESGASLDDPAGLLRYFQLAAENAAAAGVLSSSASANYWAYHTMRTVFFSLQGIVGTITSSAAKGRAGVSGITANSIPLGEFINEGVNGPVVEAAGMYLCDWKAVSTGVYKAPWDYEAGLRHRQTNPFWILNKSIGFVREAMDTLARSEARKADDMWLQSPLYPKYYLNTWHYQTDGWLSDRSAKVYETSTETLFTGCQDAMQRANLIPVAKYMEGKPANEAWNMKAMEVAAGTGRFATFFKDNFPEVHLTVSELSPFYLQEARKNMEYWKSMRAQNKDLGGWRGTGADFMQAAAEDLPMADESQDILLCTYLFHELPRPVRLKAISEFARVLKPGGLLVINDGAQLGDRLKLDETSLLRNFQTFNEPYYLDYAMHDLGAAFVDAGLEPDMKVLASASKVLSARKPL